MLAENHSFAIVEGIGHAIAVRLARDFDALVLAASKADELAKTTAEAESAGAEPLTFAHALCRRSICSRGPKDGMALKLHVARRPTTRARCGVEASGGALAHGRFRSDGWRRN